MAAHEWRCRLVLSLLSLIPFASLAQAQVYRRPVLVTNNTNNFFGELPVDVPIFAGMLSGVSPGGDNMWFVASDQLTILPHWVESWSGPFASKVWLRIPPLPPNSTMNLELRYGSPSQGASNFAATFPNSYVLASGQQALLGGFPPYHDSFEVQAGATVIAEAMNPLTIRAARIRIDGTIDARGKGQPGQFGAWTNGAGPGAGNGSESRGGGGAGYGGAGGAGGSQDEVTAGGGPAYGTSNGPDIDTGSSGGSGEVAGGAGGGAVRLMAQRIDVNGTIDIRGSDAISSFFSFGGGGGSGGSVRLEAEHVYFGPAVVRADGGSGGEPGGGGGGGGRIKVHFGEWYQYDSFSPPTLGTDGGAAAVSGVPTLPQAGAAGGWYIGSYGTIGEPSPWVSVSVGPEEALSLDVHGSPGAFVGRPTPNPSRQNVSFRLEVARTGHCRVAILDVQGRRLRSLVDETVAAGAREVSWNLRDEEGFPVPSGLYFARIEVDGSRWNRKILVAR